jgi:hypothetical protein
LTITVSAEVYRGLKRKIGPGNISRFIDRLARPYVIGDVLDEQYREMAADELREADALDWAEGTAGGALSPRD